MRTFVLLLVLAVAAAVGSAAGEPTADDHYREGQRLQTAGEQTGAAELADGCFRKAIVEYREAVRFQPDYYQAQLAMAICWRRLVAHAADGRERADIIGTAQRQFAAAAACRGVETRCYSAWGSFLITEVYNAAPDAASRREVLRQARTVFEKGLSQAAFSAERGDLQANLAICLVLLGQVTAGHDEQIAVYEKALDWFTVAAKARPISNSARVCGLWGGAHLELAKLTGSRWQARQAIERFQASLNKDPSNLEMHYNLVCAYAQVEDVARALRELRLIFEQEAGHEYRTLAASDPDLNALRRSSEFNTLIGAESATATQPSVAPSSPPISGR